MGNCWDDTYYTQSAAQHNTRHKTYTTATYTAHLHDPQFQLLLFSISAYLFPWPTPETIGVKFVGVKNVDGTFNTEVVKLTGDLQSQEVILREQQRNIGKLYEKYTGVHFNIFNSYSRCRITSYHCEVLYHSTIHSGLMEVVFVLRQADIIQPA